MELYIVLVQGPRRIVCGVLVDVIPGSCNDRICALRDELEGQEVVIHDAGGVKALSRLAKKIHGEE